MTDQRPRLSLASLQPLGRALMLRPRLMLLDEPSFGLAPLIVEELFEILRRLNQELGVAMLVVEQNAALAQSRARLGLRPGETELKDAQQAAEVKKAAADLSDAEQRYKRAQGLLETGVIARQVFDYYVAGVRKDEPAPAVTVPESDDQSD